MSRHLYERIARLQRELGLQDGEDIEVVVAPFARRRPPPEAAAGPQEGEELPGEDEARPD
jgi:hypothetical protein